MPPRKKTRPVPFEERVNPSTFKASISKTPIASVDKYRWSEEKKTLILNTLADSKKRLGVGADSGFKVTQLQAARDAIATISSTSPTTAQVKNKCNTLKKDLKGWLCLLGVSGFGRDPDTGFITADDEVWSNFLTIKADKLLGKFRYTPLANEDLLYFLFFTTMAKGTHAVSAQPLEKEKRR